MASGRFPPWKRDAWLARVAAGGTRGGTAVAELVAMLPADRQTRAAWASRAGPRAAAAQAAADEEALYARLFPPYPHTPVAGREPDRLAQADVRHAWLTTQAGALPPDGEDTTEGPETGPPDPEDQAEPAELTHLPSTGTHAHSHSNYAGGVHSHSHSHAGDASHAPGDNHQHQAAPAAEGDVAAAAGIEARRRARAAAGDPLAGASDEELFTRLFGPPPGGR